MSRGPALSGFNPSKEKYRCPVQNCNSDLNKSAAMETIEKRIEKKSLIYQHCLDRRLLSEIYNCLLCEKSSKLFCY